jgi:hypothetical protein
MPEIEIELEPIAEGQAELAREIGQLEAEGKRILDIRYPGWAADDLGIVPDAQTGNAGTYGAHRDSIDRASSRTSGDHRLSRLITGR